MTEPSMFIKSLNSALMISDFFTKRKNKAIVNVISLLLNHLNAHIEFNCAALNAFDKCIVQSILSDKFNLCLI